MSRILGLIAVAGGVFLISRGLEMTGSLNEQLLVVTQGDFSGAGLPYFGGGIAVVIVGFLLFFSSKPG